MTGRTYRLKFGPKEPVHQNRSFLLKTHAKKFPFQTYFETGTFFDENATKSRPVNLHGRVKTQPGKNVWAASWVLNSPENPQPRSEMEPGTCRACLSAVAPGRCMSLAPAAVPFRVACSDARVVTPGMSLLQCGCLSRAWPAPTADQAGRTGVSTTITKSKTGGSFTGPSYRTRRDVHHRPSVLRSLRARGRSHVEPGPIRRVRGHD